MRKLGLAGCFLLGSATAFGAATKPPKKPATPPAAGGVTINGVTYGASAAASAKDPLPPEASLRLKKVFLFPSIDDLSGALAPKLDEKIFSLFTHNTRFEVIRDPQVVKALSPDEDSYFKAALSPDVHKEAAKVTGADTTVLLRTRNVGPDTHMTLELRDAHGGLLFSEEGSVPGNAKMDDRWAQIEKLYRGVLSRLPFEGTVTGRTAATATIDLGVGSMRPNEEIEIARIVSVQRHPLLGTVIGTDYVRTGRARVTTVDRVLSFAEVIEEYPGEKVSPGQKVLREKAAVVHRGEGAEEIAAPRPRARRGDPVAEPDAKGEPNPLDERLKSELDKPRARYGLAEASLYYGSIGNSQTVQNVETPYSGGGIAGELAGELWITKNWILTGGYDFQNATLTDAAGNSIGSATWSQIHLLGGFRIYPEGMAEGIVLTAGLGFEATGLQIPSNAALSIGGRRFSGPVVQVDGDVFFLENQKINAGFAIQPFVSFTETGPSLGTPNGGTVIGIYLGWSHLIFDQLWLKIGLRYDAANGNYENTSSGLTEKRFAIGPGVYYLF